LGIFALAACSGDVSYDLERNLADNFQNPSRNSDERTVYTVDTGITPGANVPNYVLTPHYMSPYTAASGFVGIRFYLINDTPYTLNFTPHVGFFCYGPWVDTYWNGGLGAITMPGLFQHNGVLKQYGNTITIDPVTLPPSTTIVHGPSSGFFPLNGASYGSSFTDSSNLLDEIRAMQEIGKIYFIEYQVETYEGIVEGVLKQKIGDDAMDLSMVPWNWSHVPTPVTSPDLTYNPDLALIYQEFENY